METPRPAAPRSKALPVCAGIAMVVLAAAVAASWVLRELAKAPGTAAGEVVAGLGSGGAQAVRDFGAAVKEVLRLDPQIRESTSVVVEGSRDTLEVAFVERTQSTEFRYENIWAGSRKILHVQGRFRIKAGYKLAGGSWFVRLAPDGKGFQVALPAPEVLSCEQEEFQILADDDGWWNKLAADERSMVVNRLRQKAIAEAASGPLFRETENALARRLEEAARRRRLDGAVEIQGPPVS